MIDKRAFFLLKVLVSFLYFFINLVYDTDLLYFEVVKVKFFLIENDSAYISTSDVTFKDNGKDFFAKIDEDFIIKDRNGSDDDVAEVGTESFKIDMMFIGLYVFGEEVGLVAKDGEDDVVLNKLKSMFGLAKELAVIFHNFYEILVKLGFGHKGLRLGVKERVIGVEVRFVLNKFFEFISQVNSFQKGSLFGVEIVLNEIKYDLGFMVAVGDYFDEDISAFVVKLTGKFLDKESKKYHVVLFVRDLELNHFLN